MQDAGKLVNEALSNAVALAAPKLTDEKLFTFDLCDASKAMYAQSTLERVLADSVRNKQKGILQNMTFAFDSDAQRKWESILKQLMRALRTTKASACRAV